MHFFKSLPFIALMLIGCSVSSSKKYSPQQHGEIVESELEQATLALERELNDFSKYFAYQGSRIKLPNRDQLLLDEGIMQRTVFVDWSGPAQQLLSDISSLTGYRFQVIGAVPALPPLVTMRHEKIKLVDLIRDISIQIHQKADLVIFPDNKLIEVRYK